MHQRSHDVLKTAANAVATLIVLPAIVSYHLRARLIGRNRALEGSTQALGMVPGVLGQYLRRAFLRQAIAYCDATATIEFGAVFSQAGARIGRHAYIGPRCHVGLADVGDEALIGAGVHIPSGGSTHDFSQLGVPMRLQAHPRATVRIGDRSWIGSLSVVMSDVGADCVVGAGSVVTRPLPECAVAAGVPARVLRLRTAEKATA